ITSHNDKIPENYTLKHSIQGGPLLFPDLRLEEEFFVLIRDGKIVSDSASALHKYARTAIGIKENKVYIFIVTNESPMTLKELADLTQKWGIEKSMAFDGGGSTSFDSKELHIISEKNNQERKLKSFLILK
ncbi:MAG: phosphodiester glycosidase family protein, partial [Candidatus Gastranaerophilales bacterium]|nr:phosphodiester glycosidase family protein [Candidatus Gastranaerophilales bacterium]